MNATLSKRSQRFSTNQMEIEIKFTNDDGPRDVYLRSKELMSITSRSYFKYWQCGLPNEDDRCERVRSGQLFWGGTYTITFNGKHNHM